ncbi:predicted protein [Micromonas commoda]|uniref:S1 motif domain-containing protein n=1 Tax=Micromonas commoda (strain RCC299 / NOUM17 / CCMP2709) TaxID=296587 RepID=C1FHE5_MICCC|nr:predicted protein [Micromonas commoda]ACO69805.1 predicted protein [Micromonas commoda]|eukprot:XP_002508547.1 predicted protein [Micromonas commoda]
MSDAARPTGVALRGRARTLDAIARELGLRERHVREAVALMDEECTVPFIARYRKEATGGMDERALRRVADRLGELDKLEQRRDAILAALEKSGDLNPALARAVAAADTPTRLEDLYLPHRPKRATRASAALDLGLGPLADDLLDPSTPYSRGFIRRFVKAPGVADDDAAMRGARDIVAEKAGECVEAREAARRASRDAARDYLSFERDIQRIQPHQYLALCRAETAGVVRVSVEWDDTPAVDAARRALVRKGLRGEKAAEVEAAVKDGVKRLLRPAAERETRARLRDDAIRRAVRDFGANVAALILAPPMRPAAPVVGLDPAHRTGCKIAAVSATGAVLAAAVVHPRREDANAAGGGEAGRRFREFCERHGARAVAVGDGVGTREAERMVAAALAGSKKSGSTSGIGWRVVSECGASVYSASELAIAELPDLDVSLRGAVSIARRLQDPMAELVKIEPRHLGVGLYQHDVRAKELAAELDQAVESAVAAAGVNLNTASAALLARVPGMSKSLAEKTVAHRESRGPFASRRGLLDVKGVGEKTFQQAAGFLRVDSAKDALEMTAVHPEGYEAAMEVRLEDLRRLRPAIDSLLGRGASDPEFKTIASAAGIGELTLKETLRAMAKPGVDDRDVFDAASRLRTSALSLTDLKVGDVLEGAVRNVVPFGAFVDVGVGVSGLVHKSNMRGGNDKGRAPEPHEVLSAGQAVRVRVMSVDAQRNRIGLALLHRERRAEVAPPIGVTRRVRRHVRPRLAERHVVPPVAHPAAAEEV